MWGFWILLFMITLMLPASYMWRSRSSHTYASGYMFLNNFGNPFKFLKISSGKTMKSIGRGSVQLALQFGFTQFSRKLKWLSKNLSWSFTRSPAHTIKALLNVKSDLYKARVPLPRMWQSIHNFVATISLSYSMFFSPIALLISSLFLW